MRLTEDEQQIIYRNIMNSFKNITTTDRSDDDKTFREKTTNELSNRDVEYTELLTHFVSITKIRNLIKEIFKWLFLSTVIISIFILLFLICSLFKKFRSEDISKLAEFVPLLTTSLIGFVSAIIAIPITITKYLFSTKEDENITQIILHTQEHDTNGRQWIMDAKDLDEVFGEKTNKKKQKKENSKDIV